LTVVALHWWRGHDEFVEVGEDLRYLFGLLLHVHLRKRPERMRQGRNIFHRDLRLSSFDDDGEELSTELTLEACGNTRSYGGGMKICPGADPRDGLLDATMVPLGIPHGVDPLVSHGFSKAPMWILMRCARHAGRRSRSIRRASTRMPTVSTCVHSPSR